MLLNSIVAVCPPKQGIGKAGSLPWPPLRNEFKHFQRLTMTTTVKGRQNAVIMGRKTWFSIPEKNRPLKERINIVLSKELDKPPQGAHHLAKSLDDAIKILEEPDIKDRVDLTWIIGGSSLYKKLCIEMQKSQHVHMLLAKTGSLFAAIFPAAEKRHLDGIEEVMEKPVSQRIFVTRILQEFECDTFLPEIDLQSYKLLPEFPGIPSEIQEENGIQYKFEVYEKLL